MTGRFKIISFLAMFVLLLLLSITITASAGARTLRVNNSTGPVADHTSIQKAINNANEGDTILVYPGTYKENLDVNVTSLKIRSFSGNPEDTIVMAQNRSGHVFNVSSDLIEISGFTISGATRSNDRYYKSGVFLCSVSGANISYNILKDNNLGIYLNDSCESLLIGNNAIENSFAGIYLVNSSNSNTLTDNNATKNTIGIHLINSSNSNTLTGNNIIKNGLCGINCYNSSNNFLRGNNITENNRYGVSLTGLNNATFIFNRIWSHEYNLFIDGDSLDKNKINSSNLVNGKPIYYFVDASNVELNSSSNAGIVYLINCKNVTVKDQTLENDMYGIYLYNTTSSSLVNNTAKKNNIGIYLSSSSNNILIDNNASNNHCGVSLYNSKGNSLIDNIENSNLNYGIFLNNSSDNRLDGNKVIGNDFKGIYLNHSSNNTLFANKISLNKYFGIDLRDSSNNYLAYNLIENSTYNINISNGPSYVNYMETNKVESNNVLDGKLIYYFVNISDASLDSSSNAGTVYLINCNNIQLKDLSLERNGNGLYLYNTTNVVLENNTISNNYQGLHLWNSVKNSIFSNRIGSNKDCGILLTESSNNTIFNNYFFNKHNIKLEGINTGNLWNTTITAKINIANGDFLGGNFWGTPFESGFSQRNLRDMDEDNFCDSPYVIDEKNIDFLPLLYAPVQVLTYNAVGETANNTHIWNCSNCDIFCIRKENNMLAENFSVNSTENRTINKGELIYKTRINSINYSYQEKGWKGEGYPVIGFFGDIFVPLGLESGRVGKSHSKILAKLIFDSKDSYNLRVGELLYLDDGYALEAKQVDFEGEKVWLEFSKDGEFVDDEIVGVVNSGDDTWDVKLDGIQGENDIPVFKVHVNRIFRGTLYDMVQIQGLWLIDYENAFTVESGDEFGVLTVSSIEDNSLEMKNNKPIVLERGSVYEIVEGLSFKVLDSPELIYYPFKKLTTNLEECPLINDFYPLASEVYTDEGEVQEFVINTGRNSNITLFINGKDVQSRDTTTYFTYQNSNAPAGIYYVQAVARTEDEEARHSWVWIVKNSVNSKNENGGGGRSSGSSGGSAGGSPEPAKNVEVKEISQAFVTGGKHVKFDFISNVTCIESIEFDAKKTFGKTTAIIEMLKGKSQLVLQLPPGTLYRNINIWLGNEGMSSQENIGNAVIDFKVEKSWLTENNVNTSSIRLYRYSENLWSALLTRTTGEDEKYLYFNAETPCFSPFAITGEKETGDMSLKAMPETEEVNKSPVGKGNLTSIKPQERVKSPSFESWLAIFGLLSGIQLLRIKKN